MTTVGARCLRLGRGAAKTKLLSSKETNKRLKSDMVISRTVESRKRVGREDENTEKMG